MWTTREPGQQFRLVCDQGGPQRICDVAGLAPEKEPVPVSAQFNPPPPALMQD